MKYSLIHIIRFCFTLSGVCLFLFILSYFFYQEGAEDTVKNQSTLSIVIDVSQSMQVEDVETMSRLDAVKQELEKRFAQEILPVGITIFAGEAQRVLPFTTQKDLLLSVLGSVDSKNLQKQGTDIVSAVKSGVEQFLPEQTGILILFSDGGEQSLGDISDIEKKVQEQEISVIIVGVGTKEGGNILLGRDVFGTPIYKTYRGQRVVSKLEDSSLRELAEKLSWEYMDFETFQKENTLWGSTKLPEKRIYISFFLAFLFWILAILVLIFQKETWKY